MLLFSLIWFVSIISLIIEFILFSISILELWSIWAKFDITIEGAPDTVVNSLLLFLPEKKLELTKKFITLLWEGRCWFIELFKFFLLLFWNGSYLLLLSLLFILFEFSVFILLSISLFGFEIMFFFSIGFNFNLPESWIRLLSKIKLLLFIILSSSIFLLKAFFNFSISSLLWGNNCFWISLVLLSAGALSIFLKVGVNFISFLTLFNLLSPLSSFSSISFILLLISSKFFFKSSSFSHFGILKISVSSLNNLEE